MGHLGSIVCLTQDRIQLGHLAEGTERVIAEGNWNFPGLQIQKKLCIPRLHL